MGAPPGQDQRRFLYMVALIFAGEAVYTLPFAIARFFRPTMLDVFGLTATELGFAQGVYGVLALLAYFPGGALADRFPARKLMAWSLWTTAAGGVYMASLPGYGGTIFIFGFFGLSTVLLFWAALIRATRDWGASEEQGRAYGILDGGRGLLAAGMASVGVMVFSLSFPDGYAASDPEERAAALRLVIHGYAVVTGLTGVLVWFALSDDHPGSGGQPRPSAHAAQLRQHMVDVFRLPAVWMQAIVVVCAYVGFKGFDNFSLFAVQGYGLDEVEAAQLVALGAWVRPFAALGAGLLGDRIGVSRLLVICFVLLLASNLYFAFTTPGVVWVLLGNVLLAAVAICGLRGLYFAVFEEQRVPAIVTGTAVGLVSVVGYTPDIFVTLVAGILIDRSPGLAGHQHFFMFLAAFAAVGVLVSLALARRAERIRAPEADDLAREQAAVNAG
jgi:nitrate/nitrite transporter NarK